MKTYIGIYKVVAASLAFSLPLSHVISAGDGSHYSENRLQELDVIYRSALQEIEWVLENYPLATEMRKESKKNTEELAAVMNGTIQQVPQEVKRKAATYEEVLKDTEEQAGVAQRARPVEETKEEVVIDAEAIEKAEAKFKKAKEDLERARVNVRSNIGNLDKAQALHKVFLAAQETYKKAEQKLQRLNAEKHRGTAPAEIQTTTTTTTAIGMPEKSEAKTEERADAVTKETQQATNKAEEEKAAYLKAFETAKAKVEEAEVEKRAANQNFNDILFGGGGIEKLEKATMRHTYALERLDLTFRELGSLQEEGIRRGWITKQDARK